MIESFRNAICVMCAVIFYAEFSEEDDYDFDSFESSEDEIEDN